MQTNLFSNFIILFTFLFLFGSCKNEPKHEKKIENPIHKVYPTVQTKSVASAKDAADDPAIWYNSKNPSESKIIGTDKKRGLGVYDLNGNLENFTAVGKINNCDVQYGIVNGKNTLDIVAGSNRTNNSISIYKFNSSNYSIDSIPLLNIACQTSEVYGFCLYKPTKTKELFAISVGKDGLIEQFKISTDSLHLTSEKVWQYNLGGQCEGLVADNENNTLYVAEENKGIWKFNLNFNNKQEKEIVINIIDNQNLAADIEGLTMYYAKDGKGYLITSSQGNNSYAVFEREGSNKYLGSFAIADGKNIDGTSETDGIDVISLKLNESFPNGFFIAQDGENVENGILVNQNFKLVPWENIAKSFAPNLIIDNTYITK